MHDQHLRSSLKSLIEGDLSIDQIIENLKGISPMSFAQMDLDRQQRTGQAECIFGQKKSSQQIIDLLRRLQQAKQPALATRVDPSKATIILKELSDFQYDESGQCLWWKPNSTLLSIDEIGIVCAGTSDLPVLHEAYYSLLCWGHQATSYHDIGIAGLHRLLQQLPALKRHKILIVIAGMEGALPSVIAGLVSAPVIAVPTSIGYGANLQGITALLSMLSSCASGLAVVNIDNGYGAAAFAARSLGMR